MEKRQKKYRKGGFHFDHQPFGKTVPYQWRCPESWIRRVSFESNWWFPIKTIFFLDAHNFFLENTTEVRNMSNLTPRVSAIYLKPTMQEVEKDTLSFSLDIKLLKITSLTLIYVHRPSFYPCLGSGRCDWCLDTGSTCILYLFPDILFGPWSSAWPLS